MSIERGRTAAKFALVSMIIVDAVLPHAQGEEDLCVCVCACVCVCVCVCVWYILFTHYMHSS